PYISFFGVGAYLSGILNHYYHIPISLSIPMATLGGGLLSAILLVPVLRLRGIYFSMITLIFPMLFSSTIEMTRIFGGTVGLSSLSRFSNPWVAGYLAIAVTLICLFGFRKLVTTDYGTILEAIGDNDQAVMVGGINIHWYKTQVIFVGAAVGSFAGAFMTHWIGFVGIPAFALDYSILPIACLVIGGVGTYAGAFMGAFILVPFSEALRGFGGLRTLFYSLALLVFIVALPEGIFPYLRRKYHQFERWVETE
ncbi:MAG: branched-chain amino acid ABC transporter permease, partial [Thermodesulfobacteriota bacterium]|nr:branched-chain amino acid ABC transporter permease [Thermodesulfobacteriota bacterium]